MDLSDLAARESVRETVAQYAHHADGGRFAQVAALFTEDGVLEVADETTLVGRAAIQAFLDGVGTDLAAVAPVRMVRHHVTNLTIAVGAGEAHTHAYFLVVTDRGLDHWGRYRDRLVPDGDRWRFAHRRVRTDGLVPGGFAAARGVRPPGT